MTSELWAALLGALVGGTISGVAAMAGSVYVHRLELRTTMLIRLYDELLPRSFSKLDAGVEGHATAVDSRREIRRNAYELRRVALIAGRKEAEITNDLISVVNDGEYKHAISILTKLHLHLQHRFQYRQGLWSLR